MHSDTASARSLVSRPGLARALADIERGAASVLVVAKLDRLSRSLLDFAALMERSRKQGWAVVALDLGVDTTTPSGEMMANVLAVFAQFERRLIGQRTREALAVKRGRATRSATDALGCDAAPHRQAPLARRNTRRDRGNAQPGRRSDCSRRPSVARLGGPVGA